MQLVARVSRKAGRLAAKTFGRRPIAVHSQRSLVSFTFDDFPVNAWQIGGKVLAKYGAFGTYFMSLGQAGLDSPTGPVCRLEMLPELVEQGHELGCHTYSHKDVTRLSSTELTRSIEANRDLLGSTIPAYRFQSFSYPFGNYNLSAKRIVGREFTAARTIETGINFGNVDLLLLRGCSLVSGRFSIEDQFRLIDHNARLGGWLIFYTHDVQESPTSFGCTPNYFEQVVSKAAEHSDIVTLGAALHRILN